MIVLDKIRLIWFRVSEMFTDLIRTHTLQPAHRSRSKLTHYPGYRAARSVVRAPIKE
jgi:hypothetical protein